MPNGDAIFHEWLGKVQPRIQHIRNAYLAAGVLEELTADAKLIVDDWAQKSTDPDPDLAEQAKSELEAIAEVHRSYATALEAIAAQMEIVASELDKLQDERLTLAAMCLSLNVQELSVEVLERAYDAIGPDTAIDNALTTAKEAVNQLDAETRARHELRNFLAEA